MRRPAALVRSLVALAPLLLAPAAAQTLDLGILGDAGGDASLTGRIIQVIALVTVLSVAPGLLIMVTAFTRIVVVLSLLRSALGLQQSPPNMVLISLALFLTAYIMAPTMDEAWRDGLQPMLDGSITEEQGLERIVEPFRSFMLAHTRATDLALFSRDQLALEVPALPPAVAGAVPPPDMEAKPVDIRTLIPAFILSELKRAFEIGFLLFLPFLVIDMVVASLLMAMGMMMLPPVMIALPFKIIFFVLVDGWYLVAGSLIRSYGGG